MNTESLISGSRTYRARVACSDRSAFKRLPQAADVSGDASGRVVVANVPESQLYYWSREWQEREREALAELERGEGREFESPTDAIRWLMDDED